MINKPPPFRAFPIIVPTKGRRVIDQGSGLSQPNLDPSLWAFGLKNKNFLKLGIPFWGVHIIRSIVH